MKRYLLTLLLLCLAAMNLAAMTLDQCLEQAKANNKELLAAKEDKLMADQLYYDVRGSLLPQLKLQGGYNLTKTWLPNSSIPASHDFTTDLSGTASADDSTLADTMTGIVSSMIPSSPIKEGSFATQLQFSQILFEGGRLINGINAVGKYRSIQSLKIDLLKQELVTKTTDMFYQTILARKVWEIQEEGLATATKHLNRVAILNTEGQVSEFDLLRARLEVAKYKPQVVQARNNYELALSALKKQIGNTDTDFVPEGEFILPSSIGDATAHSDSLAIDLETAQQYAATKRIELKLANINSEINHIKYKAEKGNYLPSVMLTADYSIFTAADEYAIQKDDFGSSFGIGVGFSVPLFTGLSNTSKRKYAKHQWNQAQIKENDAKDGINLQVKQTYQNLQTALENYRVQIENIKLAERSLQLAQVRYDNQVGIQLEVFDALMMLNSVKVSYYNSIYEVISANQQFQKAMGYTL
jgi:outer membrane protein